MVHIHVAFWIVGSPRIDTVLFADPSVSDDIEEVVGCPAVEIPLVDADTVALENSAAACALRAFWDRVYTEWNVVKDSVTASSYGQIGVRKRLGKTAERESPSLEMLSHKAVMLMLADDNVYDASNPAWCELAAVLETCLGESKAAAVFADPVVAGKNARHAFVAALSYWTQMHDLHEPFPQGPPCKNQAGCCTS